MVQLLEVNEKYLDYANDVTCTLFPPAPILTKILLERWPVTNSGTPLLQTGHHPPFSGPTLSSPSPSSPLVSRRSSPWSIISSRRPQRRSRRDRATTSRSQTISRYNPRGRGTGTAYHSITFATVKGRGKGLVTGLLTWHSCISVLGATLFKVYINHAWDPRT